MSWKTNKSTGKKFKPKSKGIDASTKKILDAEDKKRAQAQAREIKYVGHRYGGTEWADEDDSIYDYEVDGIDVEVSFVNPMRSKREGVGPVFVIWGGGLDYDGNISGFKKRYPDLAKKLKDDGLL